MTIEKKIESLNNALSHYRFNEKYFIQPADGRLGHRFAIASNGSFGSLYVHTNYMTYDEMNSFLIGYNTAITAPFALQAPAKYPWQTSKD